MAGATLEHEALSPERGLERFLAWYRLSQLGWGRGGLFREVQRGSGTMVLARSECLAQIGVLSLVLTTARRSHLHDQLGYCLPCLPGQSRAESPSTQSYHTYLLAV